MHGSQKLSFAGKNFDDSQRTLEQCAPASFLPQSGGGGSGVDAPWLTRRAAPRRRSDGVRYWHAKFPHWPVTIRRH